MLVTPLLPWCSSDHLFLFSRTAGVETHSLLFPVPGFPGKLLPGTEQGAEDRRKEILDFPWFAPQPPGQLHQGRLQPRVLAGHGRSGDRHPSRAPFPSPQLALPQRGTRGRPGWGGGGGWQKRCTAARNGSAATTPIGPGASDPLSESRMSAGAPPPAPRCLELPPSVEQPEPGPASPHPPSCWTTPSREVGSGRGQGRKGGLMERGDNGRNIRSWEDTPPPPHPLHLHPPLRPPPFPPSHPPNPPGITAIVPVPPLLPSVALQKG